MYGILNDIPVKTLADTLEWFGVEVKEFNKSGLIFNIILEVSKILPYLCNGCGNEVNENNLSDKTKCFGCGARACKNCEVVSNGSVVFLCAPCGVAVKDRLKTPVSGFKKKAVIKAQAAIHAKPAEELGTHQTHTTKRKKSSIEADTDEEEEMPLAKNKLQKPLACL